MPSMNETTSLFNTNLFIFQQVLSKILRLLLECLHSVPKTTTKVLLANDF